MIKGVNKLLVFSPPFVSMYNQYVIICTCTISETIKHYVMLCYVMLCYVMLCYVMLCYVMLCYVMLCYVMLCYVIRSDNNGQDQE